VPTDCRQLAEADGSRMMTAVIDAPEQQRAARLSTPPLWTACSIGLIVVQYFVIVSRSAMCF